jgi:hypothetical protein
LIFNEFIMYVIGVFVYMRSCTHANFNSTLMCEIQQPPHRYGRKKKKFFFDFHFSLHASWAFFTYPLIGVFGSANVRVCMHDCTQVYTHTHAPTCTCPHAYAHVYTRTRAHTHARTYVRTQRKEQPRNEPTNHHRLKHPGGEKHPGGKHPRNAPQPHVDTPQKASPNGPKNARQ